MPKTMQIASFKGTHPGIRGLFNIACRWWLSGPYSHSVLIFSDGMCGTSTLLDGGVQLTAMAFDDQWDVIDIEGDEPKARQWFSDHIGQPYDLLGLFGFVWRRGEHERGRSFCTESCAAALGFPQPWRFDPCLFPLVFKAAK